MWTIGYLCRNAWDFRHPGTVRSVDRNVIATIGIGVSDRACIASKNPPGPSAECAVEFADKSNRSQSSIILKYERDKGWIAAIDHAIRRCSDRNMYS